jgi:hypothetical protein
MADEPFVNESFLMSGDSVLTKGPGVGGQGFSSVEIGDPDGDGCAKLLFPFCDFRVPN